MAKPTTTTTTTPARAAQRTPAPPSSLKTNYLVAYNFVCAILWATVLGRVLLVGLIHGIWEGIGGGGASSSGGIGGGGNIAVYRGVGGFVRGTQTVAVLEVLHAGVGLVRAPLLTTAMQVASRLILVWGIVDRFPNTTATSPVYSSMLLAWSITEVIRYSFFACSLWFGDVPDRLMWLRYNTFFVLYPLGISSECWLMYKAIAPAQSWNLAYGYIIKAILFIYIPGSYVLYTHMMSQRRKVLKAWAERAESEAKEDKEE